MGAEKCYKILLMLQDKIDFLLEKKVSWTGEVFYKNTRRLLQRMDCESNNSQHSKKWCRQSQFFVNQNKMEK